MHLRFLLLLLLLLTFSAAPLAPRELWLVLGVVARRASSLAILAALSAAALAALASLPTAFLNSLALQQKKHLCQKSLLYKDI